MRNLIRKIYLIVPFLMVAAACEDPEAELFSQLPADVVTGTTSDEVINVLKKGAYASIIGNWGSHNGLWSLQEISSDEMVITQKGADWEDGGQWIRVHRHEYLPSEQAVGNGWGYCFGAVANINLLLIQFGNLEALSAELKVLRALVYLWLIDAYGNVPIVIETDTDPTPNTRTRADVFAFIESSILDNYSKLPDGPSYASINKDVANAILAKLYLNAGVYTGTTRWPEAAQFADSVIASGHYSLAGNFFASFSTNNQNSVENIFVIPYDENNAGGFNLAQMTLHYSSQASFNLQEQPWNGYSSLEEFYNKFSATDDRINSFLAGPQFAADGSRLNDISAEPSDPDGPPLTFTPDIDMLFPNALRQQGVRVGKFEFAIGAGASLSNDFPIFRLGEMYLIKAEALWRQNSASTDALSLVNQIRVRSKAIPLNALTADAMINEFAREMFAEGTRRSDLIRHGRFNQAWWEKPASATTKNLFPIPLGQIQANPDLVQNEGYN